MTKLVTTMVTNKTTGIYLLKEGTGGVYRNLGSVPINGGQYPITCNPDATFREYWVGTASGGSSTIISSDDCVDYSEIVIKDGSPGGEVKIEMIRRKVHETEVRNETDHDYDLTKCDDETFSQLLEKKDGRFSIVIATKDPREPQDAPKFSLVKRINSEANGTAQTIAITLDDCLNHEQLIIKESGNPEKPVLEKMPRVITTVSDASKKSTFMARLMEKLFGN